MNLHTPVETQNYPLKIEMTDQLLFVGSCFSENIGHRSLQLGFRGLINPFGTIFNPISLTRCLDFCTGNESPENKLLYNGSVYVHPDFHSKVYGNSKKECLDSIKEVVENTQQLLSNVNWLIITFGTSIVYENIESGRIVANCHKQPKSQFVRSILNMEEMKAVCSSTFHALKKMNPKLNILCTVSPVRHTKEGLVDNNISKSALIQLCNELKLSHEFVRYFPSYEIMMDELRDYRFYKKDLIHPSELAIDIIWQKFLKSLCSKDAQKMVSDFQNWRMSLNHKPLFPDSEEHQKFLLKINERELELRAKYPHFDIEMI